MSWLDQLRSRFQGRRAILNDPRQRIGNCSVDLSGFPTERLILDVDKLIRNDPFASQIINPREQICDLIVFFDHSGTPSATLIEAKGTRYEAFGDEFKAVDQIKSSNTVLVRAIDECSIELPTLSITGAVVTGSLNHGAFMRPDLQATASDAEIRIVVAGTGTDVFDQLFGRYR